MAELIYRVSTDWQEVEKLFKEIEKLNGALDKTKTDVPREELERLTSKLGELKTKYEEIVSFSQQANDKLADAFKNVGSIDNPFKQLGEGSDKATKLLTDSFDEVITKVCELYDYIEELKRMIGSLGDSSNVFPQMAESVGRLSEMMKTKELSLANEATQNNNIIQQHQMEINALSQQSMQTKNLTDAAGERVSVENEVASTIDDTTSSIDNQTSAINRNTEAIREQKNELVEQPPQIPSYTDTIKSEIEAKTSELQQVMQKALTLPKDSMELEGAQTRIQSLEKEIEELFFKLKTIQGESFLDDLKDDAKNVELEIKDLKASIDGLAESDPFVVQTRNTIAEREQLLQGLNNKIAEYTEKENALIQKKVMCSKS